MRTHSDALAFIKLATTLVKYMPQVINTFINNYNTVAATVGTPSRQSVTD